MSCRLTVDYLWRSSLSEHVLLEAVDDVLLTPHLHLSSLCILHMHPQLFRLDFFQIIKGGIVKYFCVTLLLFLPSWSAFRVFCVSRIWRCGRRIGVLGPVRTLNHFLLWCQTPPTLVQVRMACVRGEALCRTAPTGSAICPWDRYRTDRIWKRLFSYVTTPSVNVCDDDHRDAAHR